ncbi:TetR/AcrR family transcriptional regulator [Streptomyces flavidovirens]|uniref:TetR/AcrR family transcriptional regulator n=1 Tax=Streptomyces flavidovirens TaxID=67298 RepID=UPI0036B404E0
MAQLRPGPPEAPFPSPLPGAREGRDPARAIKRGPSRVPAELVAATQRDRLYDGLVHTVAEKGYANARVTDICRAAGVTRPVFYALFDGKEDAFLATYLHGTHVLLRMMDAAYDAARDWQQGARASLGVLLELLARVPAFATMALVEIDAVGPRAREERARLLRHFHHFFAQAPTPPPPAEADVLISAVVGGIYSTLCGYVADGRTADLPGQLPHLSFFLLAPFLGPAAASAALLSDSGATAQAP